MKNRGSPDFANSYAATVELNGSPTANEIEECDDEGHN